MSLSILTIREKREAFNDLSTINKSHNILNKRNREVSRAISLNVYEIDPNVDKRHVEVIVSQL